LKEVTDKLWGNFKLIKELKIDSHIHSKLDYIKEL